MAGLNPANYLVMNPDERVKILIVEDEPILAMELSDSLEDEGYDVVGTANNGRKALDLFKRFNTW
jgi:CheY-like chemotaxis protein